VELASVEQPYRRELATRLRQGAVTPQLEQFGLAGRGTAVFRCSHRQLRTPVPASVKRLAKLWQLCANEHRTFRCCTASPICCIPHAVADLWPMLIALAILGNRGNRAYGWRVATSDRRSAAALARNGDVSSRTQPRRRHSIAAHVLLFLVFVPLVYLTALFILGVFGMQAMVDHVARRSFPELERRRGGGVAGAGGTA